jgi:hypothetical protein
MGPVPHAGYWLLFRSHWSLSKSTRGSFWEARRAVGMNLLPVSRPAFSAWRKRRPQCGGSLSCFVTIASKFTVPIALADHYRAINVHTVNLGH